MSHVLHYVKVCVLRFKISRAALIGCFSDKKNHVIKMDIVNFDYIILFGLKCCDQSLECFETFDQLEERIYKLINN